jgi:Ca2+-binding RTX toxin-like protein
VIDGFLIQGATDPGGLQSGAAFSADRAGYRFVNNIVRDSVSGIYLNSDGATQTVVQFNLFANNTAGCTPDPLVSPCGNGILSDAGLSNVLIDRNRFTGHPLNGNSILLAAGTLGGAESQSEITISRNRMVDDNAISLFNTASSSITANNIDSKQSAIYIGGGVSGLQITGNFLHDSVRGVRVAADFTVGGQSVEPTINSGVLVQRNRFERNTQAAIEVVGGRHTTVVDARFNWWGHASGPSDWSTGSGQKVSILVNFFPWSQNTSHSSFARCGNSFTSGEDVINGTPGNDILCGGAGEDVIRGRDGKDLILGGSESDTLRGGDGDDALIGESGDDTLQGDAGIDSLQGWDGADVCSPGSTPGDRHSTCQN